MKFFKKIICKLLGHNWLFPSHIMAANKRRIRPSDYRCNRCGTTKNRLFMDELIEWIK